MEGSKKRDKHIPVAISMVRKPDYLDLSHARNSHSSQFRIILTNSPHMDGQYTVFGQIIKGTDVAARLSKGDPIQDFQVYVSE